MKKFEIGEQLELNSLNTFVCRDPSEKNRMKWEMANVWVDQNGNFVRGEIVDLFGLPKPITPNDVDFIDMDGNILFKK